MIELLSEVSFSRDEGCALSLDFWLALVLAFILYTYFGYVTLLWLVVKFRGKTTLPPSNTHPSVSIVIPAYNESGTIVRAIDSVAALRYPKDRIETIVVSDSSTDETDAKVRDYRDIRVRLVRNEKRSGRNAALALAYPLTNGEIVVTMDASSAISEDSLANLTRHFSDPRVGSCTGLKAITDSADGVARGDGIYWKYEARLRELESRTGSSWVGVEGGLYAVRRELLDVEVPVHIAPDYAIGCIVKKRGYVNIYEPKAIVYELPTQAAGAELQRKVRVITRGIHAFWAYRALLNPVSNFTFFAQTVSHKLWRWLTPFFLLLLLALSIAGAASNQIARVLLILQVGFYGLATIGFFAPSRIAGNRIFAVPQYFCIVNFACILAWLTITRRISTWDPPPRVGSQETPDSARQHIRSTDEGRVDARP